MVKKSVLRDKELKDILKEGKDYVKLTELSISRARVNVDKIEKDVLKIHNKISLLL